MNTVLRDSIFDLVGDSSFERRGVKKLEELMNRRIDATAGSYQKFSNYQQHVVWDQDSVTFKFNVAGLEPNNLKVRLASQVNGLTSLTISDGETKLYLVPLSSEERRQLDIDSVKASYKFGMLSVVLSRKKPEELTKEVKIDILG